MRTARFAIGLFLIATTARLAVSIPWTHAVLPRQEIPYLFPDSDRYHRTALALLDEGRLVHPPSGRRGASAPGYPVLLAAVYRVTGPRPGAVRSVQAVLGGGTALLTGLLAGILFGERPGRLAGLLAAAYPMLVLHDTLLLSESLHLPLHLAGIAAFAWACRSGRPLRWMAASGALLGLASLVRPLGLVVPAALLSVLPFVHPRPDRRLAGGILLAVTFLLVLSPWLLRNQRVLGAPVPGVAHLGHNLYESLGPEATGGTIHDRMEWPELDPDLSEVEEDRALGRMGIEYARSHPLRTLHLAATKQARFWSPIPNAPGLRDSIPLCILLSLPYLAVLGATFAAFLRRRIPPRVALPLLAVILYVAGVHLVLIGSIRYRLPIEPLFLILAAAWMPARD